MALGEVFEFVLRLCFFAGAPLLIARAAVLYPLTGALLQIGLALVGFVASASVERLAAQSSLVRWVLSYQREFEAYYREHRPRPFLYYVCYPLLFPYWLSVRAARQEFWLFKGYSLASFAFLLLSLGVQYWQYFPPELTLRDFIPIAIRTLLVEAVVVLMFLMPIVTTVVHLHITRAPKRLWTLLCVGLISVTVAVVRIDQRRDPIISHATRDRVVLRSAANPKARKRVMREALRAAWHILPTYRSEVDSDGKVEGAPLDRAHEALGAFFKNDEAYAFDLWLAHQDHLPLLVLYFPAHRDAVPLWLAMNRAGEAVESEARLPKGAFDAMRAASR